MSGAIPPDQARALSDYRCATRKLVAFFRGAHRTELAAELEESCARVTRAFRVAVEWRKAEQRRGDVGQIPRERER